MRMPGNRQSDGQLVDVGVVGVVGDLEAAIDTISAAIDGIW